MTEAKCQLHLGLAALTLLHTVTSLIPGNGTNFQTVRSVLSSYHAAPSSTNSGFMQAQLVLSYSLTVTTILNPMHNKWASKRIPTLRQLRFLKLPWRRWESWSIVYEGSNKTEIREEWMDGKKCETGGRDWLVDGDYIIPRTTVTMQEENSHRCRASSRGRDRSSWIAYLPWLPIAVSYSSLAGIQAE